MRAWVSAALCASAATGMAVVAVVVDLDTAGQVASVFGAVVAFAGLLGSLRWTGAVHRITAGGSIGRAVIGRRNRVGAGSPSAPPPPAPMDPSASREIAAGGDIDIAIIGDDNTVTP